MKDGSLKRFLQNERLLIFYGRPSPYKKKLVLYLLSQISNFVDKIIYFDIKRCIKPHDLVGVDEDILDKIYFYWPNEKEIRDALKSVFSIKTQSKFLILLDPLFIQGGLAENTFKIGDPIFIFFSLKYMSTQCESYIWVFIDTTVRKLNKLSFFSIFKEEVPYAIYYVGVNSKIKLEIYKGSELSKPLYVLEVLL